MTDIEIANNVVKENIKDKYYNGRESWDSIAHLYITIYNDFLNHD